MRAILYVLVYVYTCTVSSLTGLMRFIHYIFLLSSCESYAKIIQRRSESTCNAESVIRITISNQRKELLIHEDARARV
jgi:hypothetical protein